MPSIEETVSKIVNAGGWDQRVAQIRQVNQNHGTGEHSRIFAEVARQGYVPHLAPDFAYINEAPFYERAYFAEVYAVASTATTDFTETDEGRLASALTDDPRTLLVFRTILGLTKDEFAHSTILVAETLGVTSISSGKVDAMERRGTSVTVDQARVLAAAITQIIDGSLFGEPPGDQLRRKQAKLDTAKRMVVGPTVSGWRG